MPRRKNRRFYGREVADSNAIRDGKLVLISGFEEFDVSPVLGFGKGKLKFEFYDEKWHMNCNYEIYAGYGTSGGNCYGANDNEECLKTLREIKKSISKKLRNLGEVDKRLDNIIEKIEGNS